MITALDTNVLLAILLPSDQFFESSVNAVEQATVSGSLVVCDQVYAELSVHFDNQADCDEFLDDNEIRLESLSREALFLASRVWRNYRRQGGRRERILPDFFVGAHAQLQTSQLVSRDRGFYKKMFPALALIDPAGPKRLNR